MADITITLTDEQVGAIMWAAEQSGKGETVGEYISSVMANAAASYAKQADADFLIKLGAAVAEAKGKGETTIDLDEVAARPAQAEAIKVA